MTEDAGSTTQRIAEITLDEQSLVHPNPDIEHERKVAIFDLLEENHFAPEGVSPGPYHLHISLVEKRLLFDIRTQTDTPLKQIYLSLAPFRKIVKDYFLMCESYYEAIKNSTPSQIEAIDMGRRGLHNEGSEILHERLEGKIETDFQTARRLFTLICVLHITGSQS